MGKKGKKRKYGSEEEVFDSDNEFVLSENLKNEMESMWELPQIYHFLQLTKKALSITRLSMYEVERMLLLPKASKQLTHILTHLLSSSSIIKSKCDKLPPMSYKFWSSVVFSKLKYWFKMFELKNYDIKNVFDIIGVEPEFWKIFSSPSLFEDKEFDDLSFRQKVWLLKTLCDTASHSGKILQNEMMKQPPENQTETLLGIDRHGACYIYFPQFLNSDLRVYKLLVDYKVLLSETPVVPSINDSAQKVVKAHSIQPRNSGVKTKRRKKCRWSRGALPSRQRRRDRRRDHTSAQHLVSSSYLSNSPNLDDSSMSNDVHSWDSKSPMISEKSETPVEEVQAESKIGDESKKCQDEMSNCSLEKTPVSTVEQEPKNGAACAKNCEVDFLSKSSKTDDEKLEEMNFLINSETSEKNKELCSDVNSSANISKSDDEKLSENKQCDNRVIDDKLLDFKDSSSNSNSPESLKIDLLEKKLESDNDSLEKQIDNKENPELNFESLDNDLEKNNVESQGKLELHTISDNSVFNQGLTVAELSDNDKELENIKINTEQESSKFSQEESVEDSLKESKIEDTGIKYSAIFSRDRWVTKDFSKLLNELNISNFKLVADSVDALEKLSESIKLDNSNDKSDQVDQNFVRPQCETLLLQRIQDLLETLQEKKEILAESTKEAKNRLYEEWLDFQYSEENEDSSQEENVTSDWVIGSDGCPLPKSFKDKSLHAESSSSSSSDNNDNSEEPVRMSTRSRICTRSKIRSESESFDPSKVKEESDSDDDEGSKPTKRVLRTRGVSSYVGHLFSDSDDDRDLLSGWVDIEAVYAESLAISQAQNNSTTPQKGSAKHSDDGDSDQEWILPSEKRKRKRSSRRTRSSQNKFHSSDPESQEVQPDEIKNSDHQVDEPEEKELSSEPREKPQPKIKVANLACEPRVNVEVPTDSICKVENFEGIHSTLNIKEENPTFDESSQQMNNSSILQQNYIVASSGQPAVANYYVMPQPPAASAVQQPGYIQATAYAAPVVHQATMQPVGGQAYYYQNNQGYMLPNQAQYAVPQQPYQQSQMMYRQNPPANPPLAAQQNYVMSRMGRPPLFNAQPRIINSTTFNSPLRHPRQPYGQPRITNTTTFPAMQMNQRIRVTNVVGRAPFRPNMPGPGGAAYRTVTPPVRGNYQRMRVPNQVSVGPRRPMGANLPGTPKVLPSKPRSVPEKSNPAAPKTTSLIVLSDDDDEIEMIVTEKPSTVKPKATKSLQKSQDIKSKLQMHPQLLQRMNEGGISISAVKPKPQTQTTEQGTKLVVVVNETGSHYALALPNGSKLILTPEQVAQIRASNDGKLTL